MKEEKEPFPSVEKISSEELPKLEINEKLIEKALEHLPLSELSLKEKRVFERELNNKNAERIAIISTIESYQTELEKREEINKLYKETFLLPIKEDLRKRREGIERKLFNLSLKPEEKRALESPIDKTLRESLVALLKKLAPKERIIDEKGKTIFSFKNYGIKGLEVKFPLEKGEERPVTNKQLFEMIENGKIDLSILFTEKDAPLEDVIFEKEGKIKYKERRKEEDKIKEERYLEIEPSKLPLDELEKFLEKFDDSLSGTIEPNLKEEERWEKAIREQNTKKEEVDKRLIEIFNQIGFDYRKAA